MSGVECVGNLDRQTEQNICLDGLSGDAILQRHALQKLHDNERLRFELSNLVDGTDVGMVQSGSGTGFSAEAFECLRVARQFIRQELQGDEAPKLGVLGLIDDTHPSTAKFLDDAVVRDDLVDHERGAWTQAAILRMRGIRVNEGTPKGHGKV